MTQHRESWVFVAGVALACIFTAVASAQSPSSGRRVRWSSDIPLNDVVRPDDTSVLVLKPEHFEPFLEEKDAERELLLRAEHADDVLVADIVSVTPAVTENGTWLTTAISARVTQLLKHNPRMPQKPLGSWQILHDGGEISINGVAVKVGAYPVIRQGRRYLMFTAHNRNDGTTHAGPAFLIDQSGTLVASETSIDGPLTSVLNGMKVSSVARLLRGK